MSAPSVSPGVLYRRSLEKLPAVNLGGIAGHPGHAPRTHWVRGEGGKRRWSVDCVCGWRGLSDLRSEAKALGVWQKRHVDALKPTSSPCPTPAKKRFGSRSVALAEVSRAWRTGRGKKLPSRVYECACGSWHMTSKPLRQPPQLSKTRGKIG